MAAGLGHSSALPPGAVALLAALEAAPWSPPDTGPADRAAAARAAPAGTGRRGRAAVVRRLGGGRCRRRRGPAPRRLARRSERRRRARCLGRQPQARRAPAWSTSTPPASPGGGGTSASAGPASRRPRRRNRQPTGRRPNHPRSEPHPSGTGASRRRAPAAAGPRCQAWAPALRAPTPSGPPRPGRSSPPEGVGIRQQPGVVPVHHLAGSPHGGTQGVEAGPRDDLVPRGPQRRRPGACGPSGLPARR